MLIAATASSTNRAFPNPACPPVAAALLPSYSAANTWNLPANPASGGSPSNPSRNSDSYTASTGDRFTSPRYASSSSEPVRFRTTATTANAPRFISRYAAR